MIRPTRPIPDRISALTGLTSGELDWSRSFSEVIPDFLDFIGDSPIVAHNADFDMGFLRIKLPRISLEVPSNPIWDNLKLGVLLYPEMQSFALEFLTDMFGITFKKTHRASDDCIATGELFVTFLQNAPSIWDKDFWKWVTEKCLVGTDLGDILTRIYKHPDFEKYITKPVKPKKTPDISSIKSLLLKNIKPGRGTNDLLIRVSSNDSENPDSLLDNKKLYKETRRHYFTFPTVLYPGDFWGIDKKWNDVIDRSPGFTLYPGRERILCRKLMKSFIEENHNNPLYLTPFEIAILNSFAMTTKHGNFSRLSWWIWNNLPKLAESIWFINSTSCDQSKCDMTDNCFYLNTLKAAKTSRYLAFPLCVLREEGKIPNHKDLPEEADLTLFNPEGIFKDSLIGGTQSFSLQNVIILMGKICSKISDQNTDTLLNHKHKTTEIINNLLNLVDNLISSAGHKRLQKGKRFFLFVTENIAGESSELINELRYLTSSINDFTEALPKIPDESISFVIPMLQKYAETLDKSIDLTESDDLILCLDKIENETNKNCRFIFYPRINKKHDFKYPDETERLFFISHHISDNESWSKYLRHIKREKNKYNYIDLAPSIPEGNRIYFNTAAQDDSPASKKKLMNIKGDLINNIIMDFPGRSLVIVRGSQELLNFKYRLSTKLKESGYWPLFQKQDGPKGLLIKEFSKHTNVVFFGLTDLFEDIHQFETSPDNLILESLHLTSLQDPLEFLIKMEMENNGIDHTCDYLVPKIHFTLTKSLRRWKNYLEGRARIFILDESIQESEYGISFLNELEGERQYL